MLSSHKSYSCLFLITAVSVWTLGPVSVKAKSRAFNSDSPPLVIRESTAPTAEDPLAKDPAAKASTRSAMKSPGVGDTTPKVESKSLPDSEYLKLVDQTIPKLSHSSFANRKALITRVKQLAAESNSEFQTTLCQLFEVVAVIEQRHVAKSRTLNEVHSFLLDHSDEDLQARYDHARWRVTTRKIKSDLRLGNPSGTDLDHQYSLQLSLGLQMASKYRGTALFSQFLCDLADLAAESGAWETRTRCLESAIYNTKVAETKALRLGKLLQVDLALGRGERAQDWLQELRQLEQFDFVQPLEWYCQAQVCYLAGNDSEAIEWLKKLNQSSLSSDPFFLKLKGRKLLATCYYRTRQYELANHENQILMTRHPYDVTGKVMDVALRFQALNDQERKAQAADFISRINGCFKTDNVYQLAERRNASYISCEIALSVEDHTLLSQQTRRQKKYENYVRKEGTRFDDRLSSVSLGYGRNDGYADAKQFADQLKSQVTWLIIGSLLCGFGIGFVMIRRSHLTAIQTKQMMPQESDERKVEIENPGERELDAQPEVIREKPLQSPKNELTGGTKRRSEILGILTRGVAHDFNNLLFVIQQTTEKLRYQFAPDLGEQGMEMLADADQAISISKEIVECLLTYARDEKLSETEVVLAEFLPEIASLLKRICGERIKVVIKPIAADLKLMVDKGLLTTSLINLCINSRDAIEGLGEIQIACGSTQKGEVEFIVEDNGCGIEESQLESIFDPFYTTKERSESSGNGIGLSMVQGFVSKSNGSVEVESKVGFGTRVIMKFPSSNNSEVIRGVEFTGSFQGFSALLVDDHPMVRRAMRQSLEFLGFDVFVADGFDDAQHCFATKLPIDLVITDVGLSSKKSGVDLAHWIKKHYPDTGIMLVSGSLLSNVPASCEFLAKPFSTAQLIEKLELVINTKRETL